MSDREAELGVLISEANVALKKYITTRDNRGNKPRLAGAAQKKNADAINAWQNKLAGYEEELQQLRGTGSGGRGPSRDRGRTNQTGSPSRTPTNKSPPEKKNPQRTKDKGKGKAGPQDRETREGSQDRETEGGSQDRETEGGPQDGETGDGTQDQGPSSNRRKPIKTPQLHYHVSRRLRQEIETGAEVTGADVFEVVAKWIGGQWPVR